MVICHLSFVLLVFLLRVSHLGRYVTPDEPAWVHRAIRFADALAARDWTAVPSTGHPGVTTMWLGAAGVAVQRLLDPSGSAAHLDWIRRLAWLAPENGEAFRHLAFFLPWGRVAVALATTLGLVVLYPLLVRLFDRRVALLTVGLLAFDPFLIGHSGLLHTDALLATCSCLSLVCLLAAARGGSRSWAWSLASGAMAGLALLTKSLAAFLFLFAPVVLGSVWLLRRMRFSKVLVLSLTWALACAAPFCALYPAMWGAPLQTLRDLFGAPAYQATTALMPTFFAGRTALRHGPEFYAVALPLRLSPIVFAGLLLSVRTFAREKSLRPDLAWLYMFALGYTLLLALSVKKYERYLLPAVPPLTLVAALVIRTLVDSYIRKLGNSGKSQPTGLPIYQFSILVLQALIALAFIPHPLTYFNPLLGGPRIAARVLPVDWGEGMGAAARWLNQQPDGDRLTVASLSVPTFAPLFDGRTVPLDQATLADYIVRPSTPPHPDAPPYPVAHIAHLGFLDHAVVYTNTVPLGQAAYLAAHAGPDDLILLDADTPLVSHYTGPGTLASASVASPPDQAAVVAHLTELSAGRSKIWLVADPAASPITAAHLRQGLEAIATLVSTDTVASATVSQYVTRNDVMRTDVMRNAGYADFNEQLTLVDAVLPTMPVNAPFPSYLRWQVPAPTPTDLHASLYLRDPAGHVWAEVGQLVHNDVYFPTSAWAPGEWADNGVTLKLPEHMPPGTYAVHLTVTDSRGAQLGAWDTSGQFQGVRVELGNVEVAPPAEPGGPALCTEGHSLTASPLLACVPELPPQAVPSGDTLTLAITWSSTAPPEADYRVRWRLLDTAGAVALEQAADLSPYATSKWRAGDSFEARYDLRIDPALPAARYTLALNVLSSEGRPLWAEDETLTTVEILPRDRLFELPADIAYPLDLTLGTSVHLRGFDLISPLAEEGTAEGILQPGDTLALTLYWQADGPTDIDYTAFVHLVGPDGRPHGQVDRFPGGGEAPTTSWAPGQVIVDEIILSVATDAPTGAYHVAVGMYDAASGGRLPVTDGSGHPLPDDQAVLPVEIVVSRGSQ